MTASELYKAGQLDDAIAAATAEVKAKPADAGRRILLAELLCVRGDLDRADTQLAAVTDDQAVPAVGQFRHLIRAETARQDVWLRGRAPQLLSDPTEEVSLRLKALVLLREGNAADATATLRQALEMSPAVNGTRGGQAFGEFRDLDDWTSSLFEVFTADGRYFWVPMATVEMIELKPAERPRDLLWRPAHMIVRGGADGVVFIPALYHSTDAANVAQRLGRATDWLGGDSEPVRGAGLRMFLVGEEAYSLHELGKCEFAV
jgi:type VI secretion system protein ImpE